MGSRDHTCERCGRGGMNDDRPCICDTPFAIEFRNGSYFISFGARRSGSLDEARLFASRDDAEWVMKQHEWILFHGGMVVDVRDAEDRSDG